VKVSRGDVVLLDFPFTDASGGKVRPAVVIQSNSLNRRVTSTIVVLVSRTIHRARREPAQLLIEANSPEGKAAGLHYDSAILCTHLYTVHEKFVTYRIGRIPASLLPTLNDCLKAALGIA
jgi:mRNA interferase MazF